MKKNIYPSDYVTVKATIKSSMLAELIAERQRLLLRINEIDAELTSINSN